MSARKFILKQLYSKETPTKPEFEPEELKALDALIDLLEENDPPDLIDQIDLEHLLGRHDQTEPITISKPSLKKKSDKFPQLGTNANVLAFIKLTCSEICMIKTPHSDMDNLSKIERDALK